MTLICEAQPTTDTHQQHPETVLARPTRHEVVMQIHREIGGSTQFGVKIISFLEEVVAETRAANYERPYRLRGKRAWQLHWHLEKIAPDDRVPQFGDGSAHDLLGRYLLDLERGELNFVHTMIGGSCSVVIQTSIRRIDLPAT